MKRMMILAIVLLLSALLALPALAAKKEKNDPTQPGQEQVVEKGKGKGKGNPESEGRRLHRAYFQKRAEKESQRGSALQKRQQLLDSNSPGNTGL